MGLFNKLFGRFIKRPEKVKPEFIDPKDILFTLPTVSNEFPPLIDSTSPAGDVTYIFDDDWRQNEFLNFSSLPLIEIEIREIKRIRENHSKPMGGNMTGFTACHVRSHIGEPNLEIREEELLELLEYPSSGSLRIGDYKVENGFSLQTKNTTYYGISKDSIVTTLCILSWNDETTGEILRITKQFNLVFINWYHGQMIREEMS